MSIPTFDEGGDSMGGAPPDLGMEAGPAPDLGMEPPPAPEMSPEVKKFIGEAVSPEKEGEVQWEDLGGTYTVKSKDGRNIVVREVGVLAGVGEPEMEVEESEDFMTPDTLPSRRAEAIKKAFSKKPEKGKE